MLVSSSRKEKIVVQIYSIDDVTDVMAMNRLLP